MSRPYGRCHGPIPATDLPLEAHLHFRPRLSVGQWDGEIPSGVVSNKFGVSTDIMPTLLHAGSDAAAAHCRVLLHSTSHSTSDCICLTFEHV